MSGHRRTAQDDGAGRGWTDCMHGPRTRRVCSRAAGCSHPPHARRRLRTSCRQSAYCSLSSQWTSSQRRCHVHRFITRRTEADSHRGPLTKFDIRTSKANRSSQREGHAGRGAVQDQGALGGLSGHLGWPRWFSIRLKNWESPEACGPFTNQ